MYNPPKGVRTPLAALTDVREKDPVTGNDDAKEPKILLIPMAIISWLASTLFPLAVLGWNKITKNLKIASNSALYIPNDLAIATDSRMATSGVR